MGAYPGLPINVIDFNDGIDPFISKKVTFIGLNASGVYERIG